MISDEECTLWNLAVATPTVPGALDVYLDWLLTHVPRRGELLAKRIQTSSTNDDKAEYACWREALGLSERCCTDMHFGPLPYYLYVEAYHLAELAPVVERLPFLVIQMDCGCPDDAAAARMMAQPGLAKIRRLTFSAWGEYPGDGNYQSMDRSHHGNQVLAALSASPHVAELEELRIKEDWMDPSYGRILAAGNFRNLRRLVIEAFPIGDQAVAELAASPVAAKLRQLRLVNHQIEDAAAIAIATHLALLEELDVRHNKIGPTGEAALRSLPALRELLI